MSSGSVIPSLMDYSILLATSELLGSDLSALSLYMCHPFSWILLLMSWMAFLSISLTPSFVMFLRNQSSFILQRPIMSSLSSVLVSQYLHSAMMAPANGSDWAQQFSLTICRFISYSAARAQFQEQSQCSLPKSASLTMAKAQNWRVYDSNLASYTAKYKSRTFLCSYYSKLMLGTIMKSTVFRWAGFHFMYPGLVTPLRQGFSQWLKRMPSFQCGRHFTYFLSRNSTTLNLAQFSLKKSLTRTAILCGLTPSISLHRSRLVAHYNLSLSGSPQMSLPKCTSASKIRYLISLESDSLMSSPSSTATTDPPLGPTSVAAASSR